MSDAPLPLAGATGAMAFPVPPLRLLVQVNLLQTWRRLLALRSQSRLLTSMMGLFLLGYLGLAFLLFHRGLTFLSRFPGLGTVLAERLLYLLFAFLFVLLLFSNLVISYTNFFRNREATFLLTLPIPTFTVFRWKLMESALLASWAFLFLIAPLLAAYGLSHRVAWHFYLVTSLLVALFIVLPSVGGAWCAIHLARYLDRRLFQVVAVIGATLLLAGAAIWLKPTPVSEDQLETRVLVVLDQLLDKTRFALFPFLPSYWLSTGVLQWSERAFLGAGFFALILLSHVLFFGFLAFTRFGDLFYDAASTVQSRGSALGRWSWFRAWQSRKDTCGYDRGPVEILVGLFATVPVDVRAIVVKDIRAFWRDTTQWGQTLMLFGLLGAYILNLRHFTQQLTNPFWVHLVSYLNLAACSLNLATLTTRFVFPQFSLEGKRVWIVGLAPLGLARIVLAKFVLATGASLAVTLGLICLSCHMLLMDGARTLYFALAITVMTFTLNGLATGVGVLYPNFKEDNPSKIVSGFGGTFCLVLSFVYIVGSVFLLASAAAWSPYGVRPLEIRLFNGALFLTFSLLLGWLPLRLAWRRLQRFEV
jgi:ABC-2 type transport system permease protein